MDWMYPALGFTVGLIVGLTGIGGGSLMTPALIVGMGISPAVAVGTDLLYAAVTKTAGVASYFRDRLIDFRVWILLSLGSIPAALISMYGVHRLGADSKAVVAMVKYLLGCALVLTACAIALKPWLMRWARLHSKETRSHQVATVVTGAVIGALVAWTSVGAGAIGTAALYFLFPQLGAARLVATEVAHAVPLTLVAGLAHMTLGNVDFNLLVGLLLGSIPGVLLGARFAGKLPDHVLRPMLALMLGAVGLRMVWP